MASAISNNNNNNNVGAGSNSNGPATGAATTTTSSRKRSHDVLLNMKSNTPNLQNIPQLLVTVPPRPRISPAEEGPSSSSSSSSNDATSYKGFKPQGCHTQQQSEAESRVEHMVSQSRIEMMISDKITNCVYQLLY